VQTPPRALGNAYGRAKDRVRSDRLLKERWHTDNTRGRLDFSSRGRLSAVLLCIHRGRAGTQL